MAVKTYQLRQSDITQWLEMLLSEYTLIAPCRDGDTVLYRSVHSADQVLIDADRPVNSAKEVLFPATETLFRINKRSQEVEIREQVFEQPQVVWGIRSCDARGIQILDAAFLENDPVDTYYARRRQQTTLVGLACHHPGAGCFCEQTGGAPDDPSGMDLMVYPIEAGYLVSVVTEKGQALVGSCSGLLEKWEQVTVPAHPDGIGRPDIFSDQQGQAAKKFSFLDLPARMVDPYWEEVAERCLSCRICAYVCPTCRCFDIRDEVYAPLGSAGNGAFERIRCWDSCAGANYRRIGGGHRPRTGKSERLRNRFLCKFYYYPEQYHSDQIACTGCGRCVELCPVNIDIREVIQHVQDWTVAV